MNSQMLIDQLNAVQKPTATLYYKGEPLVLGEIVFDPTDNAIDINAPQDEVIEEDSQEGTTDSEIQLSVPLKSDGNFSQAPTNTANISSSPFINAPNS